MELDTFALTDLDRRLRVDAAVQLLAGRRPPLRMVLFDRHGAVLEAVPRPPWPDEPPMTSLIDLLLLVRLLRPRAVALSGVSRPAGPLADRYLCELWVHVAERRATGVQIRTRTYLVPDIVELPTFEGPHRAQMPLQVELMLRAASRRGPRRLRRRVGQVAAMLRSDGHELRVTDRLQTRFERLPIGTRIGV